eukprot:CAMPEP_0203636584 /NCGR_PEP_ID=MMETSP0088-20131115/3113_1 /ASSEMBLY_ACC=CAM_ASM_001087 /TAXON_ID=426623 /ORGANISM="Chaetoceros affinis, Strain CCMP159" /LENGTH=153 /DNA_ID=CAMNT_0050490773 /DNA_START=75 /DNA_END=536 /DNA_ORIENTATION=-
MSGIKHVQTWETVVIDDIYYHTHDNGKHLSPCVISTTKTKTKTKQQRCDGTELSPNSPIVEITRHQVGHLHDPLAKQSHATRIISPTSCCKDGSAVGDGDVWVEVLCKHTTTGEIKSYFKSTKHPNRRVADEPPTGASHVIFLKPSYIEKYTK